MTSTEHIELAMTLIKQALEVLRQWREYRKDYNECPAWGTTDNRLNEAFLRKWQNYTPHKKEIIDCLLMARKHLLYAMKKIGKE